MATALAVITIPMRIMKKMPRLFWVLFLPALALFHAALVSALLALGFLSAADALSFNDSDVAEAQAQKNRALAVELDASIEKTELLNLSLSFWQQAISARPLWPYYHLGALDVEVLLSDKSAAQQRIQHIIALAPNERGLDESFLILGFIAWDWLEAEEKTWLLQRLRISNRNIIKQVFFYAKQVNSHQDICAHLAWNDVKKLCLAN